MLCAELSIKMQGNINYNNLFLPFHLKPGVHGSIFSKLPFTILDSSDLLSPITVSHQLAITSDIAKLLFEECNSCLVNASTSSKRA
jgi:hypothetical protein